MMKTDSLEKASITYGVTGETSEFEEEKPKTLLRELQMTTASMIAMLNAVTPDGCQFIGGGLF